MTAYQILNKMDPASRGLLQSHFGDSGRGAGTFTSAASAVAKSCQRLGPRHRGLVLIEYLDTRGLELRIKGQGKLVRAGFNPCGIYRLP